MSDFKSQAEIWQWLLDGNMVKSIKYNVIYKMEDGGLLKKEFNVCNWSRSITDFRSCEYYSKYTEPKPKKEYWQWLDPFDGMVTGLYFDERGLSLNEGAKNSRFTVKLEHTKILL